jgi:hypothetical protein
MYQAGGANYTVGGAAAILYAAAGKKVSNKYNGIVSYYRIFSNLIHTLFTVLEG